MPNHYRAAGKKKEGHAAKYVTRSQALKHLQLGLSYFRKLCILKGVFPREPKKKLKGNHNSYYHVKDIMFVKHEPILETLRDMGAYEKKVKKAMSKKNRDLAERLLTKKPTYNLDMLIKERYPKFIDALRDLDDCLSMVHLFAALPAVDRAVNGENIPVDRVHNCRRLSLEWQAFVSRTHKLRKTFISVKGIHYQAEVEGQKIIWLTPHALQQVLPEVDYKVLLTFLEFNEALLASINHRLYNLINLKYPPILDPQLEAFAADFYALSRLFVAKDCTSSMKTAAAISSASEHTKIQQKGTNHDESVVRHAQLQQLLSSDEPGALMHLAVDATSEDDEDADTRECKNLFKTVTFFLSREVPTESLLFVIPAFGGTVSWEGEGAPFEESDQSITHQVVDRPTQYHKFLSRDYIQPQWVYDCVNARILLPTEKYMVGCVPPPHLSPFVDDEAEGYVPEYAEAIKRLKAAERKGALRLPGTGKEDLGDPQSFLGVDDRAEAIEAAERKRKAKKHQHELALELEGVQYSAISGEVQGEDAEGDAAYDLNQIAEDAANMSKIGMSGKKRKQWEAMKKCDERKKVYTKELEERKKHEGQKSDTEVWYTISLKKRRQDENCHL
ncbi:pescadillo homolog isoform X2 [Henckelia pumila]|uniref:pescadillo homolog isoform X2 n=1 Tax=Henckelia pumila TaxID=405737 RepID=UPI003C6E3754